MLAARAEKSAQATFRVGTTVAAKPIAFGAKFAASVPGDALYRGKIVRLEDEGETEEARVWVVRYDDDGSEYATSEAPQRRRRRAPTTTTKPKAAAPKGKLHNPSSATSTSSASPRRSGLTRRRRPAAPPRRAPPRPPRRGSRTCRSSLARADMPKLVPARKPSNEEAKPPKRARRVDSIRALIPAPEPAKLFALLDLDGTLFHMMPEGELPGGLDVICEGVVPVDGPDGPRQVMAVRRGARKLLCDLHAAGAVVRVVTANLIGVEAIAALAASEADGAEPRGWARVAHVEVVRDRAAGSCAGSKKLPADVAAALRAGNGSKTARRPGRTAAAVDLADDAAAALRAPSFDDEKRKPNVIRTFSESRPQLSRRAEPA
ncbi:hypothetical protein JL720_15507 [Aureococcus anophagefferens]|nr:hypothetical protein JL720_15507 [Aureococcus anophagefferens]